MVLENRRTYLLRHVDPARQRGLEIGPYMNPTVRKDEGDVRYLDFFSTEELAAREQDRRSKNAVIPVVDYVVKSDDYYRHVSDRFDYVVANHVFEHVDNPVQWLIDLARLVHDGGVMFLTIPDKKYNFDRYRTDTPLSHLLTDFFRGHGEPMEHGVDIQLNYDTAYVGQPIDLGQKLNLEKLRASAGEPPHPGRHNHVFQSETFVPRILRPLQRLGVWPYTLLQFGGAPENHGEFYLVLQKAPERVEVSLQDVYGPAAAPPASPDAALPQSAEAREAEILRLRGELAEARNEVAALRGSLSWRLTSPVRKILGAFQ
jgi:hypothetical protein